LSYTSKDPGSDWSEMGALIFDVSMANIMFLLLLATPTFATSIVVSRTSNEVVLGADSKGTFDDGKSSTSRKVCKIYQRGNIFFAVAGLAHNPITGFDPASLVEQEIKGAPTIYALVTNVERTLKLRLERELSLQESARPDLYRRTVEDGDIPLSVVLTGTENGSPVFYMRGFKTDGVILRSDHPNGETTRWLGKESAIKRFLATQTNKPIFQMPEETVRTLIQLEIDDSVDSRSVGGPIDMVRITSKGAQWKIPSCSCPSSTPCDRPRNARAKLFSFSRCSKECWRCGRESV